METDRQCHIPNVMSCCCLLHLTVTLYSLITAVSDEPVASVLAVEGYTDCLLSLKWLPQVTQ